MRIASIILWGLMSSVLAVSSVRVAEAAESKVIERGARVNGDVVAITGDLIIRGHISGSAIANAGNIILESSARVEGDAVARQGRIIVSPGARVSGNMVEGRLSSPKASPDKTKNDVRIRDKGEQ
jgi:cytoskeletal protein CcmA (bactofilin family)